MTIINFIILLVPVAIVGFPLFMFIESLFEKVGMNILFFLISRISFLMIVYIALDFIFGFTVRRFHKRTIPFEKATSIYGHAEISAAFEWLKKKFDMPEAKLYIGQSFDEVNAYAVGSMRRKSVIITMGLIQRLKENARDGTQYLDAIKGILGHEMSHLANKDYLPGLLTSANETANGHVAGLIRWVFFLFANLLRLIPVTGCWFYLFFAKSYNAVYWLINIFFVWLFMPIYNFTMKWMGRSIEFRCDRESSMAFGGRCMALALSMMGGDRGYFSIFSTHPKSKSRISHVEDVRPVSGSIRPGIFNSLANLISILLVVFVCSYSSYKTDVPGMYEHYLNEVHYPIKNMVIEYKQRVMDLYYRYGN